MTPAAILAFLSEQPGPVAESQLTAQCNNFTETALCENSLLDLLYDGNVCEPAGEFMGWEITDKGRAALAEMTKQVAKKREQFSLFD